MRVYLLLCKNLMSLLKFCIAKTNNSINKIKTKLSNVNLRYKSDEF